MLDTRTIPEEIAAINLHAAAGLPGAEGIDVSRHLQRLRAWAELVGATTIAEYVMPPLGDWINDTFG